MTKTKKKKKSKKKQPSTKALQVKHPVSNEDLNRLEFHRNAVALMPGSGDKWPGIAIRVEASSGRVGQQHCSCRGSRSKTCSHLKDLSRILGRVRDLENPLTSVLGAQSEVLISLAIEWVSGRPNAEVPLGDPRGLLDGKRRGLGLEGGGHGLRLLSRWPGYMNRHSGANLLCLPGELSIVYQDLTLLFHRSPGLVYGCAN